VCDSTADIAIRIYDGITRWKMLSTACGKKLSLLNLHLGCTCRIIDYLRLKPSDLGSLAENA